MTYDPNDAKSIFLQAAELMSSAERAAFLERVCAGKPALKARVESLLKTALDPDSLLDQPVADFGATQMVSQDAPPVSLDFLEPCEVPGRLGRLGGYEILEVIGRGGMGIVLRAMDVKLNRVVAIKVLAPELASNPQARKRFLREAQAAAAVSHDHVVTIHAVDDDEKVPFLVMECIVGHSLQQKIDNAGALGLKEILRIGMQIASGLAAAHKQGLVHRDIKPANVLLENGVERVKITDFGLARTTDDVGITQSGQITGTPQYMSPEQAMGQPVDQRSDLFSLGSVLYTLCTGRPAFRADSAVAVLRRVCDDTPRPIGEVNAEVPDWLIAIVNRLMAKKPEDRIQTAQEVASLLEQWLAHCQQPDAVAKPLGTASVMPKAAHAGRFFRHWKWLAIALVVVLAAWPFGPSLVLVARNQGRLVVSLHDTDSKLILRRNGMVVAEHHHGATPNSRSAWSAAGGNTTVDAIDGATLDVMSGSYEVEIVPRAGRMADRVSYLHRTMFTGRYEPNYSSRWTLYIGRGDRVMVSATFKEGLPLDPNGGQNTDSGQTGTLMLSTPDGKPRNWKAAAARSNSGWILGPDGPELTDVFGQVVLKLQPSQIEKVNNILRAIHGESRTLETQHTEQQANAAGHLVIRIKPYPDPIEKLKDQLWTQLDGVLDAQQQSIARLNLKLDPPAVQPPIALTELVRPGFFGWGQHGAVLELWRVGTWHHWKIQTRGYESSGNALHLPDEYRRLAKTLNLNGEWDSERGEVVFSQEPAAPDGTAKVVGSADQWTTRIEGTFDPKTRILTGTFQEKSGAAGPIRLIVSSDGRTIQGRYAYRPSQMGADPTELTTNWDMSRIGERPAKAVAAWQSLFNGRDLTGWKPHAEKPGDWKVENSLLVGRSPLGYLMYDGSAGKSFHLRAETRINHDGYGAIVVHPAGLRPDGAFFGVWASINSTNEHYKTGHLIGIYPNYSHAGGELKQLPAPGEWFTLEVISLNGRVSVRVNGVTTHEIDQVPHQDDQIALTVGNGASVIEFRKIDVQWLPAPAIAPFEAAQAKAHQEAWAKHRNVEVERTNSIGMKFRLIPPGEFTMGTAAGAADRLTANPDWYFARWLRERRQAEGPPRVVRISQPMYVGTHEVTVGQFAEFLKDTEYKTEAETHAVGGYSWRDGAWQRDATARWHNPGFLQTHDHPVSNIAWSDAVAFCEWLSRKEGVEYRLPREAEWEYSCRAGSTALFSTGDNPASLEGFANIADAATLTLHQHLTWSVPWNDGFAFTAPVGSFKPNNFGLFDMHGNVPEWCFDWYDNDAYAQSPATDPRGPAEGSWHVYRGGGWDNWIGFCRSADRYSSHSDSLRTQWAGFRVVLELTNQPQR